MIDKTRLTRVIATCTGLAALAGGLLVAAPQAQAATFTHSCSTSAASDDPGGRNISARINHSSGKYIQFEFRANGELLKIYDRSEGDFPSGTVRLWNVTTGKVSSVQPQWWSGSGDKTYDFGDVPEGNSVRLEIEPNGTPYFTCSGGIA